MSLDSYDYSMVCAMPSAYCAWLEGFLPLLPPRGKAGHSGAHGSLAERGFEPPIASVPQKILVPQRSATGRTPSRCQTMMLDPAACYADPAATHAVGPRHQIPPSNPAIGSRRRTLLSELRPGYVYEISVRIECAHVTRSACRYVRAVGSHVLVLQRARQAAYIGCILLVSAPLVLRWPVWL